MGKHVRLLVRTRLLLLQVNYRYVLSSTVPETSDCGEQKVCSRDRCVGEKQQVMEPPFTLMLSSQSAISTSTGNFQAKTQADQSQFLLTPHAISITVAASTCSNIFVVHDSYSIGTGDVHTKSLCRNTLMQNYKSSFTV